MTTDKLFYKFLCEEGILFDFLAVLSKIGFRTLSELYANTKDPLEYTRRHFWHNEIRGYDFWSTINVKWMQVYLKSINKTLEEYYEEN